MEKKNKMSLTQKIVIALVAALICGIGLIALREWMTSNGKAEAWTSINNLLFADISAEGNEKAIGLFYIVGQLFVRAMQFVIIPMVFTSITLAMISISDSAKLGRISGKTIGFFFMTTIFAVIVAAIAGMTAFNAGLFNTAVEGLEASTGSTASNPLMILINAVPNNIAGAFTNNGGVLAIVVLAVVLGLAINKMEGKTETVVKLCQEINDLVTVILEFIINKFAPVAIFCLLTRTCAAYGVAYLKPAVAYMILTTVMLIAFMIIGYGFFTWAAAKVNPLTFLKKMSKVALFGFSTSSSAATLPLNMRTAVEDLGIHKEIASFVLPLGMTINMDGTAIMQVIAALFIAGAAGYKVSFASVLVIGLLAIVSSIGTPAAPGAGAVILFTILTGMGYNNDMALMAYTLILAINRPIEMLLTSLNVVGDTACALAVAKSENALDMEVFNANGETELGAEAEQA